MNKPVLSHTIPTEEREAFLAIVPQSVVYLATRSP